jgi:hypothetical protein
MTIIYNKNTPGQYIVTGLDSNEASETARGYHTRKTIGDFTVISSTKPVNPTNTVYELYQSAGENEIRHKAASYFTSS